MAANKSDLTGITFDFRQQTLKAYRESIKDASLDPESAVGGAKSGFHLMTAIHSLYYEPDLESSVQWMYDYLAPRGVMVVALDSGMLFKMIWNEALSGQLVQAC